MDNVRKFVPLGSILMLKKGVHRVMVVGYCAQIDTDINAGFYDYIGCLFPEGLFGTENNFVFNHEDIKEVFHLGYVDDEVIQFQDRLKKYLKDKLGKDV